MGMVKEFKEFAVKGNMVDMAVGIIIGGAFGKIVKSLVDDVVMPPIGVLIGGVKFDHLTIVLKSAQDGVPAVAFRYGAFLQECLQFVIVAFAVFLLVKGMNTMRRREEEKPAEKPKRPSQEDLLMEIRDLLRAK